jgi:transcription-repair coupling factor (superfamily II helicase)
MRDLEIRGAGNILGTEQSGNIAAVGYELYCQLLENSVRTAKKAATAIPASLQNRTAGFQLYPGQIHRRTEA